MRDGGLVMIKLTIMEEIDGFVAIFAAWDVHRAVVLRPAGADGLVTGIQRLKVAGLDHRMPFCRIRVKDVDEIFQLPGFGELGVDAEEGAGVVVTATIPR